MSGVPPVLVISGCPPGDGCVGAVILRDVVRFYEPDTFEFMIVSSAASPTAVSDPGIAVTYRTGLTLRPGRQTLSGKAGKLQAWLSNERSFRRIARLATASIQAAVARGVQRIWAVLDDPAAIVVGAAAVRTAGVPVVSLVWDCPSYFLQKKGFDAWSRKRLMRHFGSCLGGSERTGVVSESMREAYARDYGAKCMLTRYGESRPEAVVARGLTSGSGPLTIGYAGGTYALSAWRAFLAALDTLQWRIGMREVRLLLFGSDFRIRTKGRANVHIMGWRDNDEVARQLAACDLLYLPQPFEGHLNRLATLSFPTKLSTYAATGCPAFLHAPSYASLTGYFRKQPGACICDSLEPPAIAAALTRVLGDATAHARAGVASVAMAREDLNADIFKAQFGSLLGLPERLARAL